MLSNYEREYFAERLDNACEECWSMEKSDRDLQAQSVGELLAYQNYCKKLELDVSISVDSLIMRCITCFDDDGSAPLSWTHSCGIRVGVYENVG